MHCIPPPNQVQPVTNPENHLGHKRFMAVAGHPRTAAALHYLIMSRLSRRRVSVTVRGMKPGSLPGLCHSPA